MVDMSVVDEWFLKAAVPLEKSNDVMDKTPADMNTQKNAGAQRRIMQIRRIEIQQETEFSDQTRKCCGRVSGGQFYKVVRGLHSVPSPLDL
jgi:hypothetical protein